MFSSNQRDPENDDPMVLSTVSDGGMVGAKSQDGLHLLSEKPSPSPCFAPLVFSTAEGGKEPCLWDLEMTGWRDAWKIGANDHVMLYDVIPEGNFW